MPQMEAVRKASFFKSQAGLGTLGLNIGVGNTTAIFEEVLDTDVCYISKKADGKADERPASALERINKGAVGFVLVRPGKSPIDIVFVKVNGKIARATGLCQEYELVEQDKKGNDVKVSYKAAITTDKLEEITDAVDTGKPFTLAVVGADYTLPNTDDIKLRVAVGAVK